jgi:hypothetical protein
MRKAIAVFGMVTLITACAGKDPNPVQAVKMGDQHMTCNEIHMEMAYIDQQIAKLIPESQKTGKNTTLAVAGWFLIVPWFFMDFSDAEKIEIQAYQARYLELQKLGERRDCGKAKSGALM